MTCLKAWGVLGSEFEDYGFFLKRLTKKWAAACEYVELDMVLDFLNLLSII